MRLFHVVSSYSGSLLPTILPRPHTDTEPSPPVATLSHRLMQGAGGCLSGWGFVVCKGALFTGGGGGGSAYFGRVFRH